MTSRCGKAWAFAIFGINGFTGAAFPATVLIWLPAAPRREPFCYGRCPLKAKDRRPYFGNYDININILVPSGALSKRRSKDRQRSQSDLVRKATIDPKHRYFDHQQMLRSLMFVTLLCTGCGVASQPESNRTVAAFEVPLPTETDKTAFMSMLSRQAKAFGFHVDAASPAELQQQSSVSPITMNVAVWRGNDEEVVASAMDFQDHIGRVWISFAEGTDRQKFEAFRKRLMPQITSRWPRTASLPIMPSGAIPLTEDLVRTPSGYQVKPSTASKYQK